MSILETFYFLFEADAAKLEKGLDDANRKTDRLERNLQDTDKAAGMVGGSLLKIAGAAGAALGGLLAFSTIKATILETVNAMDDLGDAAAALDIPVEELSAWSMAATMVDGSQQGFIGSLQSINTSMVAIATTGKGKLLPYLKEMGLSMKDVERASKDPIFALEKMADKFQGLSRAEAAGLGAKLGLDQGTINLLSEGRDGLAELIAKQKELGVQTAEQTEKAAKFDLANKEWLATFADIKRGFVTTLLPPITEFFRTMTKLVGWMGDNKPFVIGFFTAIAGVLIGTYAPAAWASARATWALVAPWAAAAVAVALFAVALGLVTDDLYNFMKGNDSVTGEIAKKWPIVGYAIMRIGDNLAWLLGATAAFAKLFVDLIESGPEAALSNFSSAIGFLVDEISLKLPIVGEVFKALTAVMQFNIEGVMVLWNALVRAVQNGIELFNTAKSIIGGMAGLVGGKLGFGDVPTGAPQAAPYAMPADTIANMTKGRQIMSATNSPLMSQTSSSIANSSKTSSKTTTVKIDKIEVNAPQATDGDQVASAIGRSLGDQMRGAIDESDDGVAA